MKLRWRWGVLLVLVIIQAGCVTQTEKITYHRYYDPPENESILDEIRREFGWQKPSPWVREEPLYQRAARSVKETVTGWFQQDKPTTALTGGFQSLQEVQRAQKEAIERLQQQKSEESHSDNRPGEGTEKSVLPDVSGPDALVPEE